jgi:cysteine desulfurase
LETRTEIVQNSSNIYLNHHTAPLPCKASLEAPLGSIANLKEQYRILYDFLGASHEHTALVTSSGAEAVTQVLWSLFLQKTKEEGKTQFIIGSIASETARQMLKQLEEFGCVAQVIPLNAHGQIDFQELKASLGPRTASISIPMVDRFTGVVQPWEEIALLAEENSIPFHLDITHALSSIPFAFDQSRADYVTFSGEHLHAATDAGVVMVKKGAPISSLIYGRKLDLASFARLIPALIQTKAAYDSFGLETARLRDLFEQELTGLQVLYPESLRLPNTSCVAFPGVHGEMLAYDLARKGIHPNFWTANEMSFSLSRMTTEEEVMQAAHVINETVDSLKKMTEELV